MPVFVPVFVPVLGVVFIVVLPLPAMFREGRFLFMVSLRLVPVV
jgi:hypothetical protein